MKVRVKYLNWDIKKDGAINKKLLHCYITGNVVSINNDNYRDINTFDINDYNLNDSELNNKLVAVDKFNILEDIFESHNRIDDEHFCSLKDDQRSMCVGDLVFLDDDCYVVKMRGFEKVI